MRLVRPLLPLLLALTASADPLLAQCEIGVYGDPAGLTTMMNAHTQAGVPFSVYVVMFTEDTAAAASYEVHISGLGYELLLWDRIVGPNGNGLIDDEETGTNVTLGECAVGYERSPILVEELVLLPTAYGLCGMMILEANLSQGNTPVYVNCSDSIEPCAAGPSFIYCPGLPATSTSFGAVKSLYQS